jgi:hypothetical protein
VEFDMRRISFLIFLGFLCALKSVFAQVGGVSDVRFKYSARGDEVIDQKTNLIWRRCAEGMSWSGTGCTGTASAFTHEQALLVAQSQSGWRLPNVKELGSLLDRSRTYPAMDAVAFPASPMGWFWTATPDVNVPSQAWGVAVDEGYIGPSLRSYSYSVRLVR